MSGVVICPHCGAKIRAGRERCPRCRESLALPPEPSARRLSISRAAPVGFAVLVVVAVAVMYAVWRHGAAPADTSPQIAAVSAKSAVSSPSPAPPPSPDGLPPIPFIEASGAGNVAYGAGDYDRALAAYRDAVTKNPNDAESWSNMGQVLVRLERVEEALGAFRRAIEVNAGRWAYHFNLARAEGLRGNWQVAIAEYREADRLYPNDYAIAFNLGLALRKSGDQAAAARELERAVSLSPEDASFRLALARTYENLGRTPEAVGAYRRTLELAPDAPEAPAVRSRIVALVK